MKKWLAPLLILAIVIFVLAGCSSAAPTSPTVPANTTPPGSTQASSTPSASKPLTSTTPSSIPTSPTATSNKYGGCVDTRNSRNDFFEVQL